MSDYMISKASDQIDNELSEKEKLQSRIKELEDAYTVLDECYKDQEKTIKKLEGAVSELGEGLEFYANEAHWCGNRAYVWTSIDASDAQDAEMGDDFDVPVVPRIGGKKAREIITKHKDLIESIAKDER